MFHPSGQHRPSLSLCTHTDFLSSAVQRSCLTSRDTFKMAAMTHPLRPRCKHMCVCECSDVTNRLLAVNTESSLTVSLLVWGRAGGSWRLLGHLGLRCAGSPLWFSFQLDAVLSLPPPQGITLKVCLLLGLLFATTS